MASGAEQPLARVLVVDDEPSICRAVALALTRAGFSVISVTNGDDALAIVRREPVDVLLLDLRLPGMRGDVIYEMAAAVRPTLRTRTLFMTGDITEKAESLIAACKCHFLRKPFDVRDLVAAVSALALPPARDATA